MSRPIDLSPTEREAAARGALEDLGSDRDGGAVLRVRCGRNHHVAAVFDTPVGLVYQSLVGPHAHGDRDFVDTAHHGSQKGRRYTDLLEAGPFTDDRVLAGCECGRHELSRAEMQRAINAHERTILLP
jgi:hypothetical protein